MKKIVLFFIMFIFLASVGCKAVKDNKDISKDNTKKNKMDTKVEIQENKITLTNDLQRIEINPNTLEANNFTKSQKEAVKISDSVGKFKAENIKNSEGKVTFDLKEKNVSVEVSLNDDAFNIDFKTNKEGTFSWPNIISPKGIDSYILPHHQGALVPKNDVKWIDYWTQYEDWSTNEALSMPFIGTGNTKNTYTYIFENPYNNTMKFFKDNNSLGIKLSHEFTKNHKEKEFGYKVIVGDENPIEPAKNFREYLEENNQFVSLKEKQEKAPDLEKLYGAAHIYLWSSGVLDPTDSSKMIDI